MKQSIQNIQNILRSVQKRYLRDGLEIVGIFGSLARGGAGKYSDIDIAYRTHKDTFDLAFRGGFAKLLRIQEMQQELEKHLKRRVDLVSIDHGSPKLREEIERGIIYV